MRRICKRCGRNEWLTRPARNKGYCNECYNYFKSKNLRQKRKDKKLCIDCGKPVDKQICPHCNGIIKHFTRCNSCRMKARKV